MTTYLNDQKDFNPDAPFLSDDGWFYESTFHRFRQERAKHWGNEYLERFDNLVARAESEAEKATLLDARRRWLEACRTRALQDLEGIHGHRGVDHAKFDHAAFGKKLFERTLGLNLLARDVKRQGSILHRLANRSNYEPE